MATQSNQSETQASGNQVATPSEIIEKVNEWYEQRRQQSIDSTGWTGRDLRNQAELINMCLGMEQDITFLLNTASQLAHWLPQQLKSRGEEE